MKYKHLAMIMGVMITATSVGSTATVFAADSKTEIIKEADDISTDNSDSKEAPEKPDGEAQDGADAGQSEEITLDDIKEGDIVSITLDDDGNAATITVQSMEMGGGQGGPGGQDSGVDSYAAANEYSSDETVSDTSLESTETNENAALVSNGAEVTFNNDAISRTSSDSQGGDNSSFYGVGAAVLATDGTYAEGDSDYTITVGSYQDSADTSSATSVDDWSNYETEKPENL